MRKRIPSLCNLAICIAFAGGAGLAQETRGTITGRVLDNSGAVVPGAKVTVTNVATNVSVQTETNREGSYTALFLNPGVYDITASATGFKTLLREGIELRIHDRVQVDITLEIGGVNEQVLVTGQSPLLDTATANVGQVIDSRRIAELPIPHGSPYSLLFLTPGVQDVYVNGPSFQEPTNLNANITRMIVNGAPAGSTDFTIDGSPNTQTSNANVGVGMANSPPTDMVQEFKVETAFDASVGHTSGSVINAVLKTGTNRLHGTAYFFYRNPALNANTFFANKFGNPKADFSYKRWGGSFSGPVTLPKLYKGNDRTFFSFGYEGLRQSLMTSFLGSVPDPKFLTGDFSSLLQLGPQYQIYDPDTTVAAPNGRYQRQPFPNNVIPASRISPIALNILKHYPQPNVAGEKDGTNNYSSQTRPEPILYSNFIWRVDHNISDKQRVYLRLTYSPKNEGPYRNLWEDIAVANEYRGRTKQAVMDDVYTLSPTLVLNVRYGYSRWEGGHYPRKYGYDPAQLGFSSQFTGLIEPRLWMFPTVNTAGLRQIGNEGADILNNDVHSLTANFSKQLGSHSFKFGLDARAYRDNTFNLANSSGAFTFDATYTRGPLDNSPTAPGSVGQGLAALLLGRPGAGNISRNDSQAIQSTYWAAYFHDNLRVSQKLTVDLGLRWEYEGPVTERFNRAVNGFDPNATHSIDAAAKAAYAKSPDPALPVSQFQVKGGYLFAGQNGQSRLFWERRFWNFAPRAGFAYQATRKQVLRGGFGIYPLEVGQPAQNRALQPGFSMVTTLIPSLDGGQTWLADIKNPYPTGLLPAPGASQGVDTDLGRGVTFYNTDVKTPYTMRWSMNVQNMLPGQVLVEVGYLGSKSIKLLGNKDLDPIPNVYLSTSPGRDQARIDYLSQNVPNPLANLLPGTNLNGALIARNQLLKPFPAFTGITMSANNQNYTYYHSLQTRIERRFSHGVTLMGAYTWAKLMEAVTFLNAGDPMPLKTISADDRPHHIAFSGLFELPVGRGKPLLSNTNRVFNGVVGGWEVATTWQFMSGAPIEFGNIIFNGDIQNIALPRDQRSVDRWFNIDAGFERNSAKQLASNLRTFPLRFAGIRADHLNQWDISLLKHFQVREGHKIQLRGEFLNAFNHPSMFGMPDANPTSTSFGRVTTTQTLPRIVQFGLKYIF